MSTSLEKIRHILKMLDGYSDNTQEDNVRNRLDKCLDLYMSDLNMSYYYLIDNINKKSVIRGINRECE